MSWKFWDKKPADPAPTFQWPTDAYESVRLLSLMFLDRKRPPFSQWRYPDAKLPANIEATAEFGCCGLMLALWFWKFRDVHGDIGAGMARDEFWLTLDQVGENMGAMVDDLMGIFDRTRKSYAEQAPEKRQFKAGDQTVELPFAWFCAVSALTQMADSPYYGQSDTAMTDDEPIIQCMAHGIQIANAMWDLMIPRIGPFNPSSFPRWRWSANPGAHERHLQRRHGNPLFEEPRRIVTAADVYYARVKDAQALQELRRDTSEVYQAIKNYDLGPLWSSELNGFREKLDEIADHLDAIGGPTASLRSLIAELRETVIEMWRAMLGSNSDGLAALDAGEAASAERKAFRRSPWICQVLAKGGSIPPEEVIPSLLSEPVEDISHIAAFFERTGSIADVRNGGLQLVMQALAAGHQVPDHRQRLAILGAVI